MTTVLDPRLAEALVEAQAREIAHDAALPRLIINRPEWASDFDSGFDRDWRSEVYWSSPTATCGDVDVNLTRADTLADNGVSLGNLQVFVSCESWSEGVWIDVPQLSEAKQLEELGAALVQLSGVLS
jgi:hypothetical protein